MNGLGAPLIGDQIGRGRVVALVRLLSLLLPRQAQLGRHEAHRRLIEAVVGQDVVLDLVDDVERDVAVRGGHALVGLAEQTIERLEDEMLAEQ